MKKASKKVLKKKKISTKFDEFKAKDWVSHLPKPDIEETLWGKRGAEDLAFYIDWHKRHPHCNSPRVPDRDIGQSRLSAMHKDEHDPTLFYINTNYGEFAGGELPQEFHTKRLGVDCDLESVAQTSVKMELEQKHINLRDYEDPWYEKSVRDSLNSSHADGWHTPQNIFKSPIVRCEENSGSAANGKAYVRSGIKIYPTPETFNKAKDLNPDNLDALATKFDVDKPKFIGRDAKVKRGPFEEIREFTRYTKDGKYLGVWKQKELDGWIAEGLQQYEQDIIDEAKAAKKRAKVLEKLRQEEEEARRIDDERMAQEQAARFVEEVPESPTPRKSKKKNNIDVNEHDSIQDSMNDGIHDDISFLTMTDTRSIIQLDEGYFPKSPNNYEEQSSEDSDQRDQRDQHDQHEKHNTHGAHVAYDELDAQPDRKRVLKSKKREAFHEQQKQATNQSADSSEAVVDDEIKEVEYMDEEKKMKLRLGGDESLDKMGSEWINLAQWVRKKAKKKGNLFNFSGDLADACDRGDYIRAYAIMTMGASPNILHDDKPLFFHLFEKLVKMDETLNTVKVGDKLTADQQKVHNVIDMMMKFKCDIDVVNPLDGYAAIHIAAAVGSTRLVSWLIDHNCKVSLKSKERWTAMMYAVKYGHVYTVAEIVKRGGARYLHEADEEGRTPLHNAAMFGQTRVAKFLIKIGADKKKTDMNKMQPGQLAQEHGYENTAQLILSFARMPPKTEDQLQYIRDDSERKKEGFLEDTMKEAFNSLSNMFSSGMSMFGSFMKK